MSDKKHIDRIFQEKFKDFEASPNPQVWNDIQEKLNQPEKDKRRIFPFWLRFAGVAALLLLMLTVGNLLLNNNTTENTNVVGKENNPQKTTTPSNENNLNTPIVASEDKKTNTETDSETINSQSTSNNNLINPDQVKNKTLIASENSTGSQSDKSKLATNKASNNTNLPNTTSSNLANDTRITYNTNSENKRSKKNNVSKTSNFSTDPNSNKNTDNSSLALNNNSENKANQSELDKNKEVVNDTRIADTQSTSKNIKEQSNPKLDKTKTDEQLQQLNNNTTENTIAETKEENTDAEIEKTIEEELNKTDLTIEEAIAANEDIIEKEEEEIINRWQVYANVAPVYYNSMGKGSHIDGQFVDNTKTGEVNTSYGVNVSYNLNKKLSIRTGLSSLNLSYDTNDVILYKNIASGNPVSNPLKNINLSSGNESLTALSADNLGVGQIDNSLSPQSNAAISQRISYFEIPMELNYRIGNRKLGLNLIAGFSSFILDGNDVYSELKDEKTYIGEANNIKDLSFSTNFGIGLDYKFSEKVKFNLEPTFKYHINAYENTSGNFNPYIIGIYTGLSYKF